MKGKGSVKQKENLPDITAGASDLLTSMPAGETQHGNLIVFTGPSGVGKGTVRKLLLEQCPNLVMSVSVTTRQQRFGEEEGVDYFFRTFEQFEAMRDEDQLMEWAEFAGAHYGTPRFWVKEQLNRGIDVLLEIEVQGAKQIATAFPQAVLIFISPPSFSALRERLTGRGTESAEKVALRLRKAEQELKEKDRFHYEVVNDDVQEAVRNLLHIVYAERCRIKHR